MILICTSKPELMERWTRAVADLSPDHAQVDTHGALMHHLARAPDALVLLDLELPDLHDGDGVEALLAQYHKARILAFAPWCTDEEGERLVRLGIQGYLDLQVEAKRLGDAVTHVMAGDLWLTRHLMEYMLRHYRQLEMHRLAREPRQHLAHLTPRQREVALMVAEGLPNKAIARRLDISERTVKAHLSAIFERTTTQSRTELAARLGGRTLN